MLAAGRVDDLLVQLELVRVHEEAGGGHSEGDIAERSEVKALMERGRDKG
jgi:hypothetical protein